MFQGYFTNISEELSGVAHDRHTPKDRKLAGYVVVRGDEKTPIEVEMQPWGVVVGRLIDKDGKPVAGASVHVHHPLQPAPGVRPPTPAPMTDAEGATNDGSPPSSEPT